LYTEKYILLMSTSQHSIAAARAHLASLIDRVESGERIELTRRGRPVAVLLSTAEMKRLQSPRTGFREAYAVYLQKVGSDREGVEPEFFDALRDRSPGREVVL
jgi:prevent-host-death family protein